MTEVAIALGTNLGDRMSQLQQAKEFFKSIVASELWLQSSVYSTEPVNCPPGSPDYYNTVIVFDYDGSPEELLKHCKSLEKSLGRALDSTSGPVNAPRPIDADILYFGDHAVETETLVIPHPRMTLRRFVLIPLADVRASLVLPHQQEKVISILGKLNSPEPPLTLITNHW